MKMVFTERVCVVGQLFSCRGYSYSFDNLLANNVFIVIQVHIKDTLLLSVQRAYFLLSVSVR